MPSGAVSLGHAFCSAAHGSDPGWGPSPACLLCGTPPRKAPARPSTLTYTHGPIHTDRQAVTLCPKIGMHSASTFGFTTFGVSYFWRRSPPPALAVATSHGGCLAGVTRAAHSSAATLPARSSWMQGETHSAAPSTCSGKAVGATQLVSGCSRHQTPSLFLPHIVTRGTQSNSGERDCTAWSRTLQVDRWAYQRTARGANQRPRQQPPLASSRGARGSAVRLHRVHIRGMKCTSSHTRPHFCHTVHTLSQLPYLKPPVSRRWPHS